MGERSTINTKTKKWKEEYAIKYSKIHYENNREGSTHDVDDLTEASLNKI